LKQRKGFFFGGERALLKLKRGGEFERKREVFFFRRRTITSLSGLSPHHLKQHCHQEPPTLPLEPPLGRRSREVRGLNKEKT
jgi:hypothetical protein